MNEYHQITYPAFLRAYPKVLGVVITDIIWMGVILFLLSSFEMAPFWILIIILVLLFSKIILAAFFQKNLFQLWLEGTTELDWKHLMKFKGV